MRVAREERAWQRNGQAAGESKRERLAGIDPGARRSKSQRLSQRTATAAEVRDGMRISAQEAEVILRKDLAVFEAAVVGMVRTELTQAQFDVLVSFAYNCGVGALKASTLLKARTRFTDSSVWSAAHIARSHPNSKTERAHPLIDWKFCLVFSRLAEPTRLVMR